MDGYPPYYVANNIPSIFVSGLGAGPAPELQSTFPGIRTRGIRILSDVPELETEDAALLKQTLLEKDGSEGPWSPRHPQSRNRSKIRAVGRDHTLPPRQAEIPYELPPQSPGAPLPHLHSELSPLTPGSVTFPDGLMDPRWIAKHQELIPSVFIMFYNFTSDPKLTSLHDNQIKSDVNNIKSTFSQSGYRTRLVLVLLSEKSVVQSSDVEDRLSNIRRATGLDPKTSLFFLPPQSSQVEIRTFVETMLVVVSTVAVDYYRDLTKHSRRKRNRGVIPPPTAPPTSGTSQTLSSQGWNVRYDFKLGIFAEFRFEMDAAIRSYETSYETLLGTEVFEAIASWSPRWNEARMLADVISIRTLRCLLWQGNSTSACRRWLSHKERIRDLVDRRGKGSSTYGWAAWEARWATVMAELIQKADFPEFSGPNPAVYLPHDKSITMGERMLPVEFLHHPGYWYREASKFNYARRLLAQRMPEEDRNSPGTSPASHIASRAYTYDTYLTPEPHEEFPLEGRQGKVNHAKLIRDSLSKAISEFAKRDQKRIVLELTLQSARESIRSEAWEDAVRMLRPLWQVMAVRKAGWWNVVEEIGWTMRTAAAKAGDGGTVVSVDWELLHRDFSHKANWHYDISKSLDGLDAVRAKPAVVLQDKDVHSFLSTTYAFEKGEGKAGDSCSSQLAITSYAQPGSAPVVLSEIAIRYDGSIKPVFIRHKADSSAGEKTVKGSLHSVVTLQDASTSNNSLEESSPTETSPSRPSLVGEDDLTLSPGQTRIFEFNSPLREAGEARALTATLSIANELFDLDYLTTFGGKVEPDVWWSNRGSRRTIHRPESHAINILPKPPKIDVNFVDIQEQYYTDEPIDLKVEINNGEDDAAMAVMRVQIVGNESPAISVKTLHTDSQLKVHNEPSASPEAIELGQIPSKISQQVVLSLLPISSALTHDLTINVSYHLVSDPETPLTKTVTVPINVIGPFEASYDFSPRLHPDPWPSFFSHDETTSTEDPASQPLAQDSKAAGLAQKWCLTTRYASFAHQPLIIMAISLGVQNLTGGITCTTSPGDGDVPPPSYPLEIAPKVLEEARFSVYVQKLSLDDRRSASLDLSLSISWRRADTPDRPDNSTSATNTTTLPIQRLLVSSSEPRVLASASYSTTPSADPFPVIHLTYTIENPSMHFLTFGLSMELSETFAFSGPKSCTVQLLPLSRREVKYRVLPHVRGAWIEPVVVVKDKYFQKVLRVVPTEGCSLKRSGGQGVGGGVGVWVPEDEVRGEGEVGGEGEAGAEAAE